MIKLNKIIATAYILSISIVCYAKAPIKVPTNEHRKNPYVGAVSADVTTGKILFSRGADAEAYPASVTKLMTLLLIVEDVRANKYTYQTLVTATPEVYKCEPSWVGIKIGETMSVRDLCYALMVESANDAAIALGVHASGSFQAFVERMNTRASQLGMTRTKYYNPNGLPPNASRKYPWKSFNVSTANDQLKLALALLKFPEVFEFTSVKTCDLIKTPTGFRIGITRKVNSPVMTPTLKRGETLVKSMKNHNNIMRTDKLKILNPDGKEAVDGLKTGYIDAGGSSIILTGRRGKKRVVTVVLGSASAAIRDEHAKRLFEEALDALVW